MKILITGGSGVVGWNLLEFLKSKDNDVSFTFNKNKINHKGNFLDITNEEETIDFITKLNPDIVVVVAYGQLISKKFLDVPAKGFINIHGSLLPEWRGAAPIQ